MPGAKSPGLGALEPGRTAPVMPPKLQEATLPQANVQGLPFQTKGAPAESGGGGKTPARRWGRGEETRRDTVAGKAPTRPPKRRGQSGEPGVEASQAGYERPHAEGPSGQRRPRRRGGGHRTQHTRSPAPTDSRKGGQGWDWPPRESQLATRAPSRRKPGRQTTPAPALKQTSRRKHPRRDEGRRKWKAPQRKGRRKPPADRKQEGGRPRTATSPAWGRPHPHPRSSTPSRHRRSPQSQKQTLARVTRKRVTCDSVEAKNRSRFLNGPPNTPVRCSQRPSTPNHSRGTGGEDGEGPGDARRTGAATSLPRKATAREPRFIEKREGAGPGARETRSGEGRREVRRWGTRRTNTGPRGNPGPAGPKDGMGAGRTPGPRPTNPKDAKARRGAGHNALRKNAVASNPDRHPFRTVEGVTRGTGGSEGRAEAGTENPAASATLRENPAKRRIVRLPRGSTAAQEKPEPRPAPWEGPGGGGGGGCGPCESSGHQTRARIQPPARWGPHGKPGIPSAPITALWGWFGGGGWRATPRRTAKTRATNPSASAGSPWQGPGKPAPDPALGRGPGGGGGGCATPRRPWEHTKGANPSPSPWFQWRQENVHIPISPKKGAHTPPQKKKRDAENERRPTAARKKRNPPGPKKYEHRTLCQTYKPYLTYITICHKKEGGRARTVEEGQAQPERPPKLRGSEASRDTGPLAFECPAPENTTDSPSHPPREKPKGREKDTGPPGKRHVALASPINQRITGAIMNGSKTTKPHTLHLKHKKASSCSIYYRPECQQHV
ncbi:hypothetical protein GWK47_043535 [Chionoecetes opilio]|uniref:Uncharacterized protein n=1 Tax=Chionoecetes opilio TaxID=41210 RepID=A0A8J4Y844_CHIOP|nr:hypothetical protein GWK47_043535 [Chionoecetes opilio]